MIEFQMYLTNDNDDRDSESTIQNLHEHKIVHKINKTKEKQKKNSFKIKRIEKNNNN